MGDDLLAQIRENGAVPRQVAIIMDGNGRWARERSLPRPLGHRAGMKAVREAVEGAIAAGVEVLTLFAFSDENWQRPVTEISALMELLEEYIAKEVAELRGQGVAVHVLGDRTRLAPGARAAVERVERETASGTRLSLNLCISYSSRAELARAARLLAEEVLKGAKRLEDIDEEAVREKLYTAPWTDPDLLIRTSGRSEEHTSELQSQSNLVCRLLLEKKKKPTHLPSLRTRSIYIERIHATRVPTHSSI